MISIFYSILEVPMYRNIGLFSLSHLGERGGIHFAIKLYPNGSLPKQHWHTSIRQDVFSNKDIRRSLLAPSILILKLIIHKNLTENRFDRTPCKEPTWTSLPARPKVHTGGADTNKAC